MRARLLALVLAAIAIAPVFVLTYYYTSIRYQQGPTIASVQFESQQAKKLTVGQELTVKCCKVLDGYRFEMFLEGGKWIEGHLTAAAKEEAAGVVVEWLTNTAPPAPVVTLLRPVGNHWIIDLRLNVEGKRVSLVDALRSKGLLF